MPLDASPDGVSISKARLPFPEQIAFFRRKLGRLVPTARWDDITKSAHDSAFMVAGAAKADLLADLAAAVDRAIAEGTGIEAFRKDFFAAVERHGWHGWTGESSEKGRAWRTRVIYKTNLLASYAAGRFAQLKEAGFRYWIYRHRDSVRYPRPQHLAWDGLTLPADHPFWQAHFPPNGWLCHCYVVGTNNPERARRLGAKPEKKLPASWKKLDPKTGEPLGIDKGWGYAPGATAADTVRAMAEKTIQWDYALAKAYMAAVPERVRDMFARSLRESPSLADALRRYAQAVLNGKDTPPYRTMGLLTKSDALAISGMAAGDAAMFDYAIDASAVRHVRKYHGDDALESRRGQRAVRAEDYALLPALLNDPDTMEYAGVSDIGRHLVRFEKTIGGERIVAVFEVRPGRRMVALQTMFIRRMK